MAYLCLLFSSRSAAVATLCLVSLDATTRWTTVSTSGTCFASMNFTIPSLHCWNQVNNKELFSHSKHATWCFTVHIYIKKIYITEEIALKKLYQTVKLGVKVENL